MLTSSAIRHLKQNYKINKITIFSSATTYTSNKLNHKYPQLHNLSLSAALDNYLKKVCRSGSGFLDPIQILIQEPMVPEKSGMRMHETQVPVEAPVSGVENFDHLSQWLCGSLRYC